MERKKTTIEKRDIHKTWVTFLNFGWSCLWRWCLKNLRCFEIEPNLIVYSKTEVKDLKCHWNCSHQQWKVKKRRRNKKPYSQVKVILRIEWSHLSDGLWEREVQSNPTIQREFPVHANSDFRTSTFEHFHCIPTPKHIITFQCSTKS